MARRRVFRTRVQCPGIKTDLGPTANQRALVGQAVTFGKGANSEVNLLLNGVAVGSLDASVGEKVTAAMDRGQSFNAVIENAFPNYVETGKRLGNGKFKIVGAYIDLKVEYLLEKGQPAIDTEKCWRCVDARRSLRLPDHFSRPLPV